MAFFKTSLEKMKEQFDKLSDEEKQTFLNQVNKSDDADSSGSDEQEQETESNDASQPETPAQEEEKPAEENMETSEESDEKDTSTTEETPSENEEGAEEQGMEEEKEDEQDAKMDAFYEEWASYKTKIDEMYDKFSDNEKPAESGVGLGKQKKVDGADDEQEESAYQYAMKNAKY